MRRMFMNPKYIPLRLANKVRSIRYNTYGRLRTVQPELHMPPALIDASLGTKNAGDEIIMYFANKQLTRLWPDYEFYRIPKHGFTCTIDEEQQNALKILCGTNALSAYSDIYCSFALPADPKFYYRSVLLLAVGISNIKYVSTFNRATQQFLRTILTPKWVHSVRDSNTARQLQKAGIANVVNTSCVTMWDLTPEFCKTIPTSKKRDVLTTITDYEFDSQQDQYMLTTLCSEYENVYLWIQGSEDLKKVQTLHLPPNIQFIHGGFQGLQQFVSTHHEIDYFGTRLHCGIYCLNNGIRSMIVEVDNRARDIAVDTNLPTVQRAQLRDCMVSLIREDRETNIVLPVENIERWKDQFKSNQ